jgi:hypothetical protein
MSVIESIKTYFSGYTGLKEGSPLTVDYLGPNPTGYAIVPLPGERTVETYLNGNKRRVFPFAFQSAEYTADELERLQNNNFYEAFADWLEEQTEADSLPTMEEGKTAESIEALGWGYLFEQGESQTGVYQIQCQLVYEQAA